MQNVGTQANQAIDSISDLSEKIADLRVEREIWAQELFETHRYTQSLVTNRQHLAEQLNAAITVADELRIKVAELEVERDAMVTQRQTIEDHLSSTRKLLIERTRTAEMLSEENGRLRAEVELARRRPRST